MTRPVVYGQFTDANHILRDLLRREGERAMAQVAAVLPADITNADPIDTFTQVAEGFFIAVTASPQRWRSILLPVDGVPAPVRKYKEQGEAAVRVRIAEITRWFTRNEPDADRIDVDLLAHLLLTTMEEGGRLVLNDPGPERLLPVGRDGPGVQTMLDLARDNLEVGRPVVLDAPFGRYLGDPRFVTETVVRHRWPAGVTPVVVQVRVDGETARRRIEARGYARDRSKLADWDSFWDKASANQCRWDGVRRLVYDNVTDGVDRAAVLRMLG